MMLLLLVGMRRFELHLLELGVLLVFGVVLNGFKSTISNKNESRLRMKEIKRDLPI